MDDHREKKGVVTPATANQTTNQPTNQPQLEPKPISFETQQLVAGHP